MCDVSDLEVKLGIALWNNCISKTTCFYYPITQRDKLFKKPKLPISATN